MIKKYIACILTTAMVLSCIPAIVSAKENTTYTAIRDTYISEEEKSAIYGLDETLELSAQTDKQKKILLGFRIRENIGEYDQVFLKMRGVSVEKAVAKPTAVPETTAQPTSTPEVTAEPTATPEAPKPIISVSQTTKHEWLQTNMNWSNALTAGTKISDVEVTSEVSVDVSAYVKSSKDANGYLDTFSDLPRNSIYYVDVQACYENGIIGASKDGKFNPENKITYDEVAMMLYNAAKVKHIPMNGEVSQMSKYVDDSIAQNIRYSVYQLKLLGVIDDSVSFRSGEMATNTDIALMFYNFMQLVQ